MRAEALIFDIDGTLWDSRELVARGYNQQLHQEGLDHLQVSAEQFLPLFGKVAEDIADVLFPSIPAPERYNLMYRCMDAEERYMKDDPCQVGYPGVRETLEALSKNHRLFIVSNSQKGYPELCMEKLGLTGLFQGHLCYGDTGTEKGLTIRTLMKNCQITDAVYIGDTLADQQAADLAGIGFIWCSYGFGKPEHFDAKIDSFPQLLELEL